MTQNITLLGASYSDVPSVELPATGGGTASFTDVTDTTAAAADVASGKYFYTSAGVRTAGTASGGGSDYPVIGDGKTYFHIQVTDIARPTVSLRFTQTVSNGVTVDWGDGSATETYSGTSAATHTHTYSAAGEYTIVLDVTSGRIRYGGSAANSIFVTNATTDGASVNRYRLLAAEIGTKGVTTNTIGTYSFYYCYFLRSITIPDGTTSIGSSAFYICSSLTDVTIPSSVTSIGSSAFSNAPVPRITIPSSVTSIDGSVFNGCKLLSVTIPEGVTQLKSAVFSSCSGLETVTIPSSVTSIAASAFSGCSGVKEYHLLPTTPPTLANTNAFTGIASDCIIYVPSGSLEAYQTATNWSTYASYMQEE